MVQWKTGRQECLVPIASGVQAPHAFLRNCRLSDVLDAATWRTSTTFTSFYLNDLAFNLEEVRSLGPLVAAGQVVD